MCTKVQFFEQNTTAAFTLFSQGIRYPILMIDKQIYLVVVSG